MDRTDRIPLIEDVGKHLLFLRPRRFGKSMLLSMLENYYDVARADAFETLFGHLAIGRNPTDLHNQYFILKWDFSAVDPQGEPKEIRDNLHCYINERIENFSASYQGMLPQKIRIRAENAMSSFQSLLTAIRQTPRKLYLLVDEYDNFANELMMGSREISADRYKSLVYGEGCLKAIFKVVKAATAGEGLDRAFITGVSPVVMSGITSGHNIAKNVYLRPEFNDLCGFWESEIREVLGRIAEKCGLSGAQAGEALDMMRCFYNGYAFTYEQKPLVYNPTLAIYFLEHFQDYCGYPRRILDSNLAMDRGKITYISRLPHGEEVILNALSDETPLIIQDIADRFGVEDMLTVTKDTEFMASLLYFFGVLTLTDQQRQGGCPAGVPDFLPDRRSPTPVRFHGTPLSQSVRQSGLSLGQRADRQDRLSDAAVQRHLLHHGLRTSPGSEICGHDHDCPPGHAAVPTAGFPAGVQVRGYGKAQAEWRAGAGDEPGGTARPAPGPGKAG